MVAFFLKWPFNISEMSNFSICAKSWSSIKDFGGLLQDNFVYFMKPNQILSWKIANFAFCGPISKTEILNRFILKATNK